MSTITRFEDLEVWQLARKFAAMIYQLTLQENFSKEYKLKDQIKGSSGSVMDMPRDLAGKAGWSSSIFLELQKGHRTKRNHNYTGHWIMP